MALQVAVCGPSECTAEEHDAAYQVGVLLAERGVSVVCGGGSGVMAAVAKAVRAASGTVVGILPGPDRSTGNAYLTAAIATNMGEARNAIIVSSADAVISVGGSWGTLSEVALAAHRGIPVVCLNGWRVLDLDGSAVPGIAHVATAMEAVEAAMA